MNAKSNSYTLLCLLYNPCNKLLFTVRTFALLVAAYSMIGCSDENLVQKSTPPKVQVDSNLTASATAASGSLGLVGDAADVNKTTQRGTVLMGGSTDVDAAIQWMITKSGGGDFVVIRSSGTDAYNSYIYDFGGVNSVETLLIDSRTLANNTSIEAKIRGAEALFIAGGDQATYFNYWKDTKVEDAINYLINTKKCPVGGTSAGCAVQGKIYYTAANGTITSSEALSNPFNSKLTLQRDNFLDNSFLANTVTDTHFDNPDRRGRLVTFMARMSKDWGLLPKGIGVDEETAVCIDENGSAKIFGSGTAFFLSQTTASGIPEKCVSGSALDWYRSKQSIKVYKVNGTTAGSNTFNVSTWTGSGGSSQYFYVDRGAFKTN